MVGLCYIFSIGLHFTVSQIVFWGKVRTLHGLAFW